MLGNFLTAFTAGAVGEYNDRGIIYDTKAGKFTSAAEREAEKARTDALAKQRLEAEQKVFDERLRILGKVEEKKQLDALDQVKFSKERETAEAEAQRLDALYNPETLPPRGFPYPEGYDQRRVRIIDVSVGPDNKIVERTIPVTQDLAEARAKQLNATVGKQTNQVFYSMYDPGKNGFVLKSATKATPPTSYPDALALAEDLANKLNENTDTTFKATVDIEQKNGKPSYIPKVISTSGFSSKDEAEVEAQRRNEELKTAGSSNRAFVEVGGDGVITVVVRGVTGKQDTSKPENDPKITDQTTGVRYGFNYHLAVRDADPNKFEIIYLKDGLSRMGEEQATQKEGEDFVILPIGSATDDETREQANVLGLNDAITEKVVDKMIENGATNQLDKLVNRIFGVATGWQQSKQGSIKNPLQGGGVDTRYLNFYDAVPIAAYLRNKYSPARDRFDKNEFLIQALEQSGEVRNNPLASTEGEINPASSTPSTLHVYEHPVLVENPAFVQRITDPVDPGATVTVFKPEFSQNIFRLNANSGVPRYTLGKIITEAPDIDRPDFTMYRFNTDEAGKFSSPESSEDAYLALLDIEKLFNKTERNPRTGREEPVYSFSMQIGSATKLTFPFSDISSRDKKELVNSLETFGSTNNGVIALKATIPVAEVKKTGSFRFSGAPTGQMVFAQVTNKSDAKTYAALPDKQAQALKLKEASAGAIDAIDAGAVVGFETGVTRVAGFFETLERTFTEGGRLNQLFFKNVETAEDEVVLRRANDTLQKLKGNIANATDEAQQKDAILKYNLTIASYAYASMNDPNGRLSDADRQNADDAIGALGQIARVEVVKVILENMFAEAERKATYLANYQTGKPRTVLATFAHETLTNEFSGGGKSIKDLFGSLQPAVQQVREATVSIETPDSSTINQPIPTIN